jgi:hypothetical protein
MTSFRSADVIKWLIEACPTSLLEKDEGGHAPLHIAGPSRFGGRGHDAKMLVAACPRALLCTKDSKGRLPLHVEVAREGLASGDWPLPCGRRPRGPAREGPGRTTPSTLGD